MRINFNHLHIENFMSYEDADIDLAQEGYIVVKGINNNPADNAKSNGTGKSSLFSAISWVLTGETISGIKNVNNINTENGALVELDFDIDNHTCKIIRTRDHSKYKTNLKIFIDDEDKSGKGIRDGEKLLNEYFPELTSSLINSVIILGQGLPKRFSNNTPSGRKEVLEQLSKSDFMISDLKNRVINRKSELNSELRTFEDDKLKKETELESNKKYLSDLINTLNEIKSNSIEDLESDIIECSKEIEELNTTIESLYIELEESSNLKAKEDSKLLEETSKKESSIKEVEDSYKIKIDTLKTEISDSKAVINQKQLELNKLASIVDTCPTCGQKLPDVEKIDTSLLESEICDLKEKQNVKLNNLKSEEHSKTIEIEKITAAYKDIIYESSEKKNVLDADISNLNYKIKENEQSKLSLIENKTVLTSKIENIKNNKTIVLNNISKYEEVIDEIEKYIEEVTLSIENINTRIDIISKMSTILTRDFRGFLLTNVINFIDKKAKEYALHIFNNDNLNFVLDGNNISIKYEDKEYESLSGGERQKVDIIIQLSIRDMLCSFLNFSSNIIVLDEITDNLDELGAEALFNLISSKLNDVSSIYVISHHQDFSIPVDNEIIIVKGDDKISRII